MILPLRRAHLLSALVLAVLFPIVVAIALARRPAPVLTNEWHGALCFDGGSDDR